MISLQSVTPPGLTGVWTGKLIKIKSSSTVLQYSTILTVVAGNCLTTTAYLQYGKDSPRCCSRVEGCFFLTRSRYLLTYLHVCMLPLATLLQRRNAFEYIHVTTVPCLCSSYHLNVIARPKNKNIWPGPVPKSLPIQGPEVAPCPSRAVSVMYSSRVHSQSSQFHSSLFISGGRFVELYLSIADPLQARPQRSHGLL